MKFHPLTHCILAVEAAIVFLILPSYQNLAVFFFWLMLILVLPRRTEINLTGVFIKILGAAAFFLFLIHGVVWMPFSISRIGIYEGLDSFLRISAPVVTVLYLSRQVRQEELFAFLIDLRIPSVVIFILFRTLWLVPRFMERIDEVITAQKLRGMRIESFSGRIKALLPTLGPIFSSMLEETSENSLTLTTRGFLQPGTKTHLAVLSYSWIDAGVVITVTSLVVILWF